ncbi:MAG: ferritin family protein [Smithellaceae bacterium]|nr:ferritin family protein [Smithellaceae bacterium]
MSAFEARDIVEFAIRIEENGEAFYRWAAGIAKEAETVALFNRLAQEETQHRDIFARLLKEVGSNPPHESYEGEYGAYLRDYVDNNIVFTKETMAAELAKVKDTRGAVDFAIRRELDSILYYHEIRKFLSISEYDQIEKIIEEERRHFQKLSELKKFYAA